MRIRGLVMILAAGLPAFPAIPGDEPKPPQIARALDDYLTRRSRDGFAGVALLAQGSTLLLEKAYGMADRRQAVPNKIDTLFDIGSLTKTFTAAAVLRLEMQGKLKLSDSIAKHLPGVPPGKRGITLQHLLTHASGLPLEIPVEYDTTRDAFIARVMEAEPESPPGERFAYNNVGYRLLAAIVEVVSRKPFETYLTEQVFQPAGMRATLFCSMDPASDRPLAARRCKDAGEAGDGGSAVYFAYGWGFRGCSGIVSNARDLWRWERALQGEKILSAAAKAKCFTPAGHGYACGWYVARQDGRTVKIHHQGTTVGFHAGLYRYPERDLTLVILSNNPAAHDEVYEGVPRIVEGGKDP